MAHLVILEVCLSGGARQPVVSVLIRFSWHTFLFYDYFICICILFCFHFMFYYFYFVNKMWHLSSQPFRLIKWCICSYLCNLKDSSQPKTEKLKLKLYLKLYLKLSFKLYLKLFFKLKLKLRIQDMQQALHEVEAIAARGPRPPPGPPPAHLLASPQDSSLR